MVVGAAHTEKAGALLSDAQRPFAVITSLSLAKDRARIPPHVLEGKYAGASIDGGEWTEVLRG
jgi:hypothetical protein